MRTNHRRKKGRSKKGEGQGWHRNPYSLTEYRRLFWHRYRAKVRHLMGNERFDEVPDRIPPSILWDYW